MSRPATESDGRLLIDPIRGLHRCGKCAGSVPRSLVYFGTSRRWFKCRPCRAKQKQGSDRLRGYGMSPGRFTAVSALQGGACAICGRVPPLGLAVDHCHATGAVRGLLCRPCNSAIGLFQESTATMLAAIRYVEHHKQRQEPASANNPQTNNNARCGTYNHAQRRMD